MRLQARDPKRIEPTLRLIGQLWAHYPDLRLGQLILNFLHPHCVCPELYVMEDDVLLRHLGVTNPPPTRPSSVTIDCSSAQSEQDVHEAFADALSFPNHYGQNWDAFWDVLTEGYLPPSVTILGRQHLEAHVPGAIVQLERCFSELLTHSPEEAIAVTWA